MMTTIKTDGIRQKIDSESGSIHLSRLATCLLVLFLLFGVSQAKAEWPGVVSSKDGTLISYEIQGLGDPTLVFVHG
ncbi:MAG: hypothetical protein PVG74_25645, partial [Desulfobacterales bacterium]